jgi:hypothetical protein
MVGVEELADGNSRHIVGGDITKTSDHVLTISACACWDSTYSDYLETTSSDTVTIASDANTLYNIFIVRLVADDSIEFRAYEVESDIDADADVNTYRWLMEWSNDGSGVLRPGYSVGDYKLWSRASKSVISAGVTTSFAIVDHTTQINTDRAELIHYGANSASVETFVTASLDGTYVAWTVSRTIATNDMSYIAWGQDMPGHFVPFSADVKFKADSGTVNLLVHQVKYRR